MPPGDDDSAVFYGVAQDPATGRWVVVIETPDEIHVSDATFSTKAGALAALDQEAASMIDYLRRQGIIIQSLPVPPEEP